MTTSLTASTHRFGLNYTPSHNWWYCWNDWKPDPIARDLDAIAALGADHIRIMLLWPSFQPNPGLVSPAPRLPCTCRLPWPPSPAPMRAILPNPSGFRNTAPA